MASEKQQLIQLHQLLAEIRLYAGEKTDYDTSIDSLENYRAVGITSIDLDAAVQKHEDAILTLASDLATVLPVPITTAEGDQATLVDVASAAGQTQQPPAANSPQPGVAEATVISGTQAGNNQVPATTNKTLTDVSAEIDAVTSSTSPNTSQPSTPTERVIQGAGSNEQQQTDFSNKSLTDSYSNNPNTDQKATGMLGEQSQLAKNIDTSNTESSSEDEDKRVTVTPTTNAEINAFGGQSEQ